MTILVWLDIEITPYNQLSIQTRVKDLLLQSISHVEHLTDETEFIDSYNDMNLKKVTYNDPETVPTL